MNVPPTDLQATGPQTLAAAVTGDHRALRLLLEATGQPPPPEDWRAPRRATDAFVVGMCEHLGAEADVLHPAARRLLPDGAAAVAAARGTHRALQRQMRLLQQDLWGDARAASVDLGALRRELDATFREHARHDEQLAGRVDEALDEDARGRALADLHRAATRAPTRPHPHAPQRGPLAGPVRWLAGRWDDVLDTLDVRSAADRRAPRPRKPLSLWGGYLVGQAPPGQHDERPPTAGSSPPGNNPTA